METRQVSVRDGAFNVEILEGGSGAPLLYLHGWRGLEWDAFLDRLARTHRVIAPRHPGYGETTGDDHLLDFHDLLIYYLDLLDALGLKQIPVVGHSLGAMVAVELAALQPDRFTKLGLIAPFGLWNPEHPVADFFVLSPADLSRACYFDQESPAAQAAAATPATDEGRVAVAVERVKSMRVAAKYLWPIPNRGLSKRIHRVTAPTLIVWGANDGICPPAYAEEFASRIQASQVQFIEQAGHLVEDEQPASVADALERFLKN